MDNENLSFLCNARAQQATTTRGVDGSASPSVWVSESPTDCWSSGLNQSHPTHPHSYDVTQMFRTEFCALMRFSKVNYGLCLYWHMFIMKGFSSVLSLVCQSVWYFYLWIDLCTGGCYWHGSAVVKLQSEDRLLKGESLIISPKCFCCVV